MSRHLGKLTALGVTRLSKRGYYADGGGLYLQISASGNKSWVFRFRVHGKLREMGLGPQHTVSLAEAREKAADCRRQRLDSKDPIEERRAVRVQAALDAAKVMTFRECAKACIASHEQTLGNPKHAAQWTSTLERYAYPVLGDVPVQKIDTALVLKVLEPIWADKTETATRVRQRIEKVLSYARARGYCNGDNPAHWGGHLSELLPAPTKLKEVEHFASLPHTQLGEFLRVLRRDEGVAASALEFTILTASRSGQIAMQPVKGMAKAAKWSEVDLAAKVWIVPAERMKGKKSARREHRVPLSKQAIAVLKRMESIRRSEFIFPGWKQGKPLSSGAMDALLERLNYNTIATVHGFRATFKTWAEERTGFSNIVIEMAMAHTIGSKVEAAYMRGDLFEKRRKLMDAWGDFCERSAQHDTTENIISIDVRKSA